MQTPQDCLFWYTAVLLLRSATTTININVCTYSSCQVILLMGTCNAPLLLDAFDKVLTGLGIFFGEEHVEFANVGLVAVGRNSWEALSSNSALCWVLDKEANGRLDQHLSRCLVLDRERNVIDAFSVDKWIEAHKTCIEERRDAPQEAVVEGILYHMPFSTSNCSIVVS